MLERWHSMVCLRRCAVEWICCFAFCTSPGETTAFQAAYADLSSDKERLEQRGVGHS